eukprot:24110-Amphidinium_carterae.1
MTRKSSCGMWQKVPSTRRWHPLEPSATTADQGYMQASRCELEHPILHLPLGAEANVGGTVLGSMCHDLFNILCVRFEHTVRT